jgi:hypothetical protein
MLGKKGIDVSVPWELATDAQGWPLLPLELALPLQKLKEIIRSFVTLTYSKHLIHFILVSRS